MEVSYLLKRSKRRRIDLAAAMGLNPSAVTGRLKGTVMWTAKDLDHLSAYFDEPCAVFLIERPPAAVSSAPAPRPRRPAPPPRRTGPLNQEDFMGRAS